MTDYGSFIVNGTERVIVSQLHRSPGVFFEARQGQDAQLGQAAVQRPHHPVPRLVAGLRVRPQGHPVLRVDRRRKMPVTILLKAIGLNPEAILANFFVNDNSA